MPVTGGQAQCVLRVTNSARASRSPAPSDAGTARDRWWTARAIRSAAAACAQSRPAGPLDRVGGASHLPRCVHGSPVERGKLGGGRGVGGEGRDHRQGLLVGGQVRPDRFARAGRVPPDADQVVDELEGEARLPAEAVHGADGPLPRTGVERAEGAGAAEQGARLGHGHGQALVERDVVGAAVLQGAVGLLSRAELDDAGGEPHCGVCGRRVRVVRQQSQGEGEHGVARDDGVRYPEHRPGRGPVAPGGVLVDDVVVEEGEVVREFDRDGRPHRRVRVPSQRTGGGQDERRSDGLARLPGRGRTVGVLPAEVVHGDPADRPGQRLDGRPEVRVHGVTGVFQERGGLVPLHRGIRTDHGHGHSFLAPRGAVVAASACRGPGGVARPGPGERHRQRLTSTFSRTPRASGTRTAAE